ncbi:hypothetical protein CDCA_CDCA17G4334 [Cyanidium caldarium]|uniref:Inositol 2-dehydrogenase n=1 Tax=Cyanidium caldarium TaxID=2771 RepID=A0AAV9J1W5_CYACA|nr:hypothetical protein CDCA_CDCA17G4334 [Cyanidium caldarium]
MQHSETSTGDSSLPLEVPSDSLATQSKVLVTVLSAQGLPPFAKAASAPNAVTAFHVSKIRVGIIGCGRIGQVHAQNIAIRVPHAILVAVSDFIEEAAMRVAERFDVPLWYKSAEDLVHDPRVDAVVICSPTDTHAPLMKECVRYGKHAFCEKPIALDLATIDDALATVAQANADLRSLRALPRATAMTSNNREEQAFYEFAQTEHNRRLQRLRQSPAGIQLMVAFQRRYDHNFQRARQTHDAGFVGRPLKLHLVSRDPAPPPIAYLQSSGGIWVDQAIHDFDMARFLLKSEAVSVFASGLALDPAIGELGDCDHVLTQLRFANGALCVIDNSRATPHQAYDQRAELFGSAGSIFVHNVHPNTNEYMDTQGVHRDKPLSFFIERYADAYLQEMQVWVQSLVEGGASAKATSPDSSAADGLTMPIPSGFDGRIAVVMAMAARKSFAEKRPVDIVEVDPSLAPVIRQAEQEAASLGKQ